MAAYAYEVDHVSLVTGDEFDALVVSIDPTMVTGNKPLDEFFRTEFVTFSDAWIRAHPDLESVRNTYEKFYRNRSKPKSFDQRFNTDLFGPLLVE